MSSASLNVSSTKYSNKSSSQNDNGSQQSDGHSNLIRSTPDQPSIGSIEQISNFESCPSIRLVGIKISPISTAVNSISEKMESSSELEDIETSNKYLQTESGSFNSHLLSNYNQILSFDSNTIIEEQQGGDLHLPLAEEQDSNPNACQNNNPCTKKRVTNNGDPVENLVSAALAFREASHNQCDLLKAQTSAINRLATAIEDQNVMMYRFHSIVQKTSTKNIQNNDGENERDDRQ